MKERFGGVLAVALGAVLITTGIHSSSGAVGALPPDCGVTVVGGFIANCPTGTINIAETTTPTPGVGDPTPPSGGWKVEITSDCNDPTSGNPVDITLTIPEGGNTTSEPLFVYTNNDLNVSCSYTLAPQHVTGFTSSLDPASPVTIPYAGGQTNSGIKVNLAETFVRVTPTTPASTPVTTPVSTPASASSSPVLAETGPRTAVGTSVYLGIALCLLGGVMLFGGTFRRRRGQHS